MTASSKPQAMPTTPNAGGPDGPPEIASEVMALPDTPLAKAVLTTVLAEESVPLAHHSIRSFLFARLLAGHRVATADHDYDEQLLFAACVLHDIGLAGTSDSNQRFEVDGADRAARLLTDHGLAAQHVDAVWEAIALHTSFGIAERRGVLCQLTRGGVGMDFGYGTEMITDHQAMLIHTDFPRLSMERSLVDAIVGQATRTPAKAPRYSIASVLVGERATAPHVTQMELAAAGSRWNR